MDQQNRYTPPNSDTSPQSQRGEKPSIEEALSRGYHFGIGEVISKAWKKTKGLKLKLLIAHMIFFTCSYLWGAVEEFISMKLMMLSLHQILIFYINMILSNAVLSVFTAGIIGMTLNHYRNQPVKVVQIFNYFALFVPIFLLNLVSSLLTIVGMLLLIIPGIYLAIAYGLSTLILIDNQALSFWGAMEASRKAITQHWFRFFFLILALVIILIIALIPIYIFLFWIDTIALMYINIPLFWMRVSLIALIPLGVGLLWAIPLLYLSIAVVYERIFGAR